MWNTGQYDGNCIKREGSFESGRLEKEERRCGYPQSRKKEKITLSYYKISAILESGCENCPCLLEPAFSSSVYIFTDEQELPP